MLLLAVIEPCDTFFPLHFLAAYSFIISSQQFFVVVVINLPIYYKLAMFQMVEPLLDFQFLQSSDG